MDLNRQKEREFLRLMRLRERTSFDALLMIYVVIGIIIFLSSSMYLIFSLYEVQLSEKESISLIFAGSGVMISILSYAILRMRQKRTSLEAMEVARQQAESRFVTAWATFEEMGKTALLSLQRPVAANSPRSLISTLLEASLISHSEERELHTALQWRNAIVHGLEVPGYEELISATATLHRITKRLINS
ncbi:hypothetical protein QBK99_07820 [Corticibacterium sp. UT-5YL-CI-8]|nr:hypothetical protein [Tianweitania sp. UT-5YL-CI-8]